jgi:hypothetical protein
MADKKIINGYTLHKQWFDFAFDNPDKVTPAHGAVISWLIELNNKMDWRAKFASPASQTMAATGIKSYNTYKKVFENLVGWGFITVITAAKNQHTACVIALSNFDRANINDQSLPYQILTEQHKSTSQSTDSIYKQETLNHQNLNDLNNNVIPLSRKKIINDAIDEFCDRAPNSEPVEQLTDDLKEKSCAKKEKVIPTVELATEKIEEFALWRHVIEHHGVSETERADMFKYFYEYNTDSYRIRYPTWCDMIKHFYNWVPIHKSKKQRQDLNGHINRKARGTSKDKRNELFNLADQSTAFLRQTGTVSANYPINRTDKIDQRNNSASDALTRLADKFGGGNG